jgi:hypothetical protein
VAPGTPGVPGVPGVPGEPALTPGTPGAAMPGGPEAGAMPGAEAGADLSGLVAGGSAAGGGSGFTAAGYVESAIPVTQYRLRVDFADDDNRPDRADFFYPKCGCFRTAAKLGLPGGDPNAPGPGKVPASKVDFTELSNYFEYAYTPRISAFINIPVRYLTIHFQPFGVQNETESGLSDIDFGFKYAMIYQPDRVLTFQLRTYTPTGDARLGLGRNNWNLEPALLYYHQLSPRMYFEGELRDFIPVSSQDDFAGNVIRYGGALSYLVYNQPCFRIAPVAELVGWTCLTGQESNEEGVISSAKGDTIVNAKIGVRVGFGELLQPGYLSLNRCDFYVGYGRALTGDVWYKDIGRAEFRLRF